jgi:hypothetical protein
MRTTMPATFETSFADALLRPDQPVPPGVVAHDSVAPVRRFAVYRNNVVAGLGRTLQRRFPAVERIVGEEFFAAMARMFVMQRPPRSPLLATYGDEFPGFIEAFEPAREIPYLPDVARLEAARTRAYHAADAMPIDINRLSTLAADALGDLSLALHPSVEVVRSLFPIVTIWAMNSGEQPLGAIDDWGGEDALIARPNLEVEIRKLPPGGAAFLLALAGGLPVCEAVAVGLADDPGFDLTAHLVGLIGSGLVRDIVPPKQWERP